MSTLTEAAKLIRSEWWKPGAWTPARCYAWHNATQHQRDWLGAWVWKEYKAGKCHPAQLPAKTERKDAA